MPKARIPSPSTSPCPTPPPESQVLSGLTIHIIDAKLDPKETREMHLLAQSIGAKLSRTTQHASVLVTALTMKRRLERHVSWDIANMKYIVSPQWLRACAIQNKLVPFSQFQTIKTVAGDRKVSVTRATADPTHDQDSAPGGASAERVDPNNYAQLSTHRRSPLVCPNQELCLELATLMKARFLEGEYNSELSYSRAIATLKAYPKALKDAEEVRKLPYIGPKIQKLIEEYLKTGKIAEVQKVAVSERFQVLSLLTKVHGVGAAKAKEHYSAGHKTLEDLIKYYGTKAEAGTHMGIFAALQLHSELNTTISREEVKNIAKNVFDELSTIQPGCDYTICGGYRRGKPYSNDIDIIFTHQQTGLERHLCTKLVEHLKEIGMVTHVLNHSAYTSNHEGTHGHQHKTRACMDVLDKALVILKPKDSLHRRVDLIFAPYSVYWTAIVGWTGSKQFERDLRIHAKQQGLKFDSGGITRLRDSKPIVAYSEEEVFSKLGLKYVEPAFRNADV
ncbi:finger of DNA polymerase lambda domain protein [Rhizoctonia solani AG-3 Rhs1AP]|uniref:DNA polymerase n=2 Tax=Rhizoctonia solani AG-3 TaxID=1086053 RepID=A0A074S8B0_9AGAM|nr:finger of DNA polymerase lambda domain protein [Rhizoctonia solani AG-3 Rhs1AP]KEP55479.1 finger of DNA polymerase lambda domain protein [Rhizoctonia solani 123E]